MFRSFVRCDLRAHLRSDERSRVAHPALADAGQHPPRSDDLLRHDADRSHPEPVLEGRGDRRRTAAVQHSVVVEHVFQRPRYHCHHQLLDADVPFSRRSTSHHLLSNTGESVR